MDTAQAEAGAFLILVPCCTDTMAGFNRVALSARARALQQGRTALSGYHTAVQGPLHLVDSRR